MPKGNPPPPQLKKRIVKFRSDKYLTQKQFDNLSWNHLNQIGTYNQKNGKKPKSVEEWKKKHPNKSHTDWQSGKKGKRNETYKK